jgi:hypothetical protein
MPSQDPAKLKKVSISLPFGIGSAEWEADTTERKAAWSLYIELVNASEDKKFVSELVSRLEKACYRVWYDERSLKVGDKLEEEIDKGIKASSFAIVVISRNYFSPDKVYTLMEFNNILPADKIIPIFYQIDKTEFEQEYPDYYNEISKWLFISQDQGMEDNDYIDYIIKRVKIKIDNLKSDCGIDYIKLRDLLARNQWKDADEKTYALMIEAIHKRKIEFQSDNGGLFNPFELFHPLFIQHAYLTSADILKIPCQDLCTIDQLWVKYSQGRFGFSVQKTIYLKVGGEADGSFCPDAWERFYNRVGWDKKYLIYTAAFRGQLPAPVLRSEDNFIQNLNAPNQVQQPPLFFRRLIRRLIEFFYSEKTIEIKPEYLHGWTRQTIFHTLVSRLKNCNICNT